MARDADADDTRIKGAVIDAGIDVTHPCFFGAGFPQTSQLGDRRYTNNKVIVARVFSNKSRSQGYTAEAIGDHGMDVVNMSLGGRASGSQDLLTRAVDNLDRAGMVSAISAGNEGPGHYTVGSPGSAERAITSGASTVGHFVGAPVTVAGRSYGAASGDFATVAESLIAPWAVVTAVSTG